MVAVLGLPGRFGDVTLHRADIRTAAKGQAETLSLARMIGRIWDRIKDWFCNTHVGEAKSLLAKLYDPGLSDRDRISAYFSLKALVSDAYRDRFAEKDDAFGFRLTIDFAADGLLPFSHSVVLCNGEDLARRVNDELARAAEDPAAHGWDKEQLAVDLPRADYSIEGELLTNLAGEEPGQGGSSKPSRLPSRRSSACRRSRCSLSRRLPIRNCLRWSRFPASGKMAARSRKNSRRSEARAVRPTISSAEATTSSFTPISRPIGVICRKRNVPF